MYNHSHCIISTNKAIKKVRINGPKKDFNINFDAVFNSMVLVSKDTYS